MSNQPNTTETANGQDQTTATVIAPPPHVGRDAHAPSPDHGEPSRVPIHASRGTGFRTGVAAVLFAAALAGGYVYGLNSRHHEESSLKAAAEEAADAPTAVEVVAVHRAPARKVLTLPGEARALNETTLYARTSGYINKWLVDIGDHVKAGQTLAIIDTPELDDQLAAAKAKVVAAQSNINLAEASANFAKLTYDRWASAAPEGVVSEQERDQKKSEVDTSQAKVEAAKADLQLAQAEVHRLETLVGFKNVTAPFDGTITQRHIDIGDLVTAGSTTNTTPLFSLARADKLRVFVDVPQSAAPEIKDRMAAAVTASEYPGRTFPGAVDRTANSIDRASRTMRVEVLVDNPDMQLKPGGYVQVEFRTDRRDPPLEIPAAALTFRPGGAEVAVVAADGTVKFRPITIGQDLGDRIEVATGLEPGDRVALNVGSDVTDGEKILARETATGTAQADAVPTAPARAAKPEASREAKAAGPTADARS